MTIAENGPVGADGVRDAAASAGPTLLAPLPVAPEAPPAPEAPAAPTPVPTPETPAAPEPEVAAPDTSTSVEGAIRQLTDLLEQARADRETEQARARAAREQENDPVLQILNDPETSQRERLLASQILELRTRTAASEQASLNAAAAQADAEIASEVREFSQHFNATPSEIQAWRVQWDNDVRAGLPVESLSFTQYVQRSIGTEKMFARYRATSPPPAAPKAPGATRMPGAPIVAPAQGGGPKTITPATANEDFDKTTARLLREQFGIVTG